MIFSIAVIEKGKKKGKNRKNEKNIEKDSDLEVWLIEVLVPALNTIWIFFDFAGCIFDSKYVLLTLIICYIKLFSL